MKDISGHWAEDDIRELAYMEILKGDNRKANPDQLISRAEFIALLVRALNYGNDLTSDEQYFNDVKPTEWYYRVVSIAKEKGIVKGNGNGTFFPDKKITREEIVLTLIRAMQLEGKSVVSKSFKDIKSSYPYKTELNAAIDSGIINGYEDNTFRPGNNALRAEAAVMIKRMLNIIDGASGTSEVQGRKEKTELTTLIKKYINEYIKKKNSGNTDLKYNLTHSIGREYNDNQIKADIIELYRQKDIKVQESNNNMDIEITQLTKYLAEAEVLYDAKYTRTFDDGSRRVKSYKVEKKFSLRKMQDGWKIYNVKDRLYQDQNISLVWEQVSVKTPDMSQVKSMEGLDVISPTWFELRRDTHPLGVKAKDPVIYKDSKEKIHMVDMGDDDFIQWAHQKDYDVWGLFRNEFDKDIANKMLNDREARRKSIELLLDYTKKYKLDGINIDFENVYYDDRHELSQFVRELAPVLREQGLVTSVDVTKIEPTSWTWSMCYDRKVLGEEADYIMLMTYDQNGSWSKKSGSVAQYSWVEKGLQGVLEQVPKEKMFLGIPLYTRVWEEENGRVTKTTAISMQTADELIKNNGAILVWDEQSGQYLATYKKGYKTYKIWMEDANSINLKTSLVHKYGLAGVAAWRRGFEKPEIWHVLDKNLKYDSYDEWARNNSGKWYMNRD